ncbi:MAG: phage Gp37/Gp68 family protein [Patescibacteria group bacterium]|nr:phage Gp37/Gp68 family protein [Patescibacteria group bacterium]
MKTTIEWTDRTWNPIRGCTLVSAGCENCYAMRQAHRFSSVGAPYEGLTDIGPQGPRWTGKIRLVPELLHEPLRWKKPCRVFVNSMSDLFHKDVPLEFLLRIWDVMASATVACEAKHVHKKQCWSGLSHTFQILTKRPDRMRQVLSKLPALASEYLSGESPLARAIKVGHWPLPNVWLGVSVEHQMTAAARLPVLLQTTAAVRFVSAEPLLGSIDLAGYLRPDETQGLDWVIVGAESGPRARLCDLRWIQSIVRQCRQAAVPCFVKQVGPRYGFRDRKGGDPSEWPPALLVRQWPTTPER